MMATAANPQVAKMSSTVLESVAVRKVRIT